MILDLYEEPVPPTGAQKAEGVKRVLGTPSMGPLTVVLREAVQNSWDARIGDAITFGIHYYKPSAEQKDALLRTVFAKQPAAARIRELVQQEDFSLMVFEDRGTCGLNGPTQANLPAETPKQKRNFVDFVFDIGRDHGKGLGAGTYGFGKASYYSYSASHTVILHTRCLCNGVYQQRLIAAHLGASVPGRTTGRAWWALPNKSFPMPLLDDDAAKVAAAIGLTGFSGDECGTSIVVLAPRLVQPSDGGPGAERATARDMITSLGTSMVQWFWPKMLPDRNGKQPITFTLTYERSHIRVPAPSEHAPYGFFAEGLRAIETFKVTGAQPPAGKVFLIESASPRARLGHLCLLRRAKAARTYAPGDYEEESARELANQARHVALLRGPRLVVRYLAGPTPPTEMLDVAGVFLVDATSEAGAVEDAFALSEPPVHDDWVPTALDDRRQKVFVNGALKRIRENLGVFVLPSSDSASGDTTQPGLGAFSEMMGGLITNAEGTSARSQSPRGDDSPNTGAPQAGRPRIHAASAGRLQIDPILGRVLLVPFTVNLGTASKAKIEAKVQVVLEGGVEREPPDGISPVISGFRSKPDAGGAGSWVTGDSVEIVKDAENREWIVVATVPSEARIKVTLHVAD